MVTYVNMMLFNVKYKKVFDILEGPETVTIQTILSRYIEECLGVTRLGVDKVKPKGWVGGCGD